MPRTTRSSSVSIKRKKQPSNLLFLLNSVFESLLIADPVARLLHLSLGQKPFNTLGLKYNGYSLLFPGVSNQTGLLVLNLFTAAVICFCAIPSFLVFYWKLPRSESKLIAAGSLVYHLALGTVLTLNWNSGGDPMGPVLIGEGDGDRWIKHVLGIALHSILFIGFAWHLSGGKKNKEKEE